MSGEAEREQILRAIEAELRISNVNRAIDLARAALDDGHLHPLLLNLRAYWLESQGKPEAALTDLRRASELAPSDAVILNAIGLNLSRQGRMLEAHGAFLKACEAQPDLAPAFYNRGWAAETMGELDDARRSYERTVELTPDAAEPVTRLAALAARRADWKAARSLAERALALNPGQTYAILARSSADAAEGHYDAADAQLTALLADPAVAADDRYYVYGALGDLRHLQGRFADAFAAYATGNDETWRVNVARFARSGTAADVVRDLATYFTRSKPWVRPPALAPEPGHEAPHVFLLGFPRSGTTLLEQSLASHPDVATMDEKEAMVDAARDFMTRPGGLDRMLALGEAERRNYRALYWQRVSEFGIDAKGKAFVDKLPFNTLKLPLIAHLFPEAKILFAQRDPRDVVLSCFRRRFRTNAYMIELLRLESAAKFYSAYMSLAELYRARLPLDIHTLKHEDMVDDFEGETRKVCGFIGIEWNAAMNEFTKAAKQRAIATPSSAQLAGGLSREGVGQWRLYREQMAPVFSILAPWVEKFGYPAA